jgi:hypothetical protein
MVALLHAGIARVARVSTAIVWGIVGDRPSVCRAPDGTCHLRRAAATRRTPPPSATPPTATHPATRHPPRHPPPTPPPATHPPVKANTTVATSPLCKGATLRAEEGAAAGGRKPPPSRHQGRRRPPYSRHQIGQIVAKVMLALLYAPPPRRPPALPPSAPAPATGPSAATHPSPPLPSPQPARGVLRVEAAGLLHDCGQSGGTARITHEAARARRPRGGAPLLERAPPPLEARAHLRRPRAAPPAAAALPLPGQRRRRRSHAVMALR